MDRTSGTTGGRSTKIEHTPHQEFPSAPTQDLAIPSASLPILPDEVINAILLRLPVKSLVRFKCVSRSWLSLISSPEFIKAHLKFHTSRDSQRILIKGYVDVDDCVKQCSLNCLMCDEISTDVVMFDNLNWEVPSRTIVIVGSSNGLVCIDANVSGLFLWNPSTGKSKELPDLDVEVPEYSDQYYIIFGFGYDEVNDDYKVVEIICTFDDCAVLSSGRRDVNVYSMRNESWKRLGNFQGGYIAQEQCGIVLNGNLHWPLKKEGYLSICCVDLPSETYREMGLPNLDEYYDSDIDIFQGSLCMLCRHSNEYTHTDVWIMKEYGIRESWMKVLSIPHHESWAYPSYKLLCTSEDEKILLINGPDLVLYNAKDGSFKSYKVGLSSSSADLQFTLSDACVYVESLVSLNQEQQVQH
ncbi:F-box/kelch-repeat protein At3g06240-like [Coffea arabica]|uniref:F-box/kelch-repeat protein At3g06240-like n=1 Tax=Coffea arabica TaxID=13443 RepID=A0A6P6WUE5_COFAR|nr:F-box/kelch-repeat protein At3g06240-like [Coffea arabica]